MPVIVCSSKPEIFRWSAKHSKLRRRTVRTASRLLIQGRIRGGRSAAVIVLAGRHPFAARRSRGGPARQRQPRNRKRFRPASRWLRSNRRHLARLPSDSDGLLARTQAELSAERCAHCISPGRFRFLDVGSSAESNRGLILCLGEKRSMNLAAAFSEAVQSALPDTRRAGEKPLRRIVRSGWHRSS